MSRQRKYRFVFTQRTRPATAPVLVVIKAATRQEAIAKFLAHPTRQA